MGMWYTDKLTWEITDVSATKDLTSMSSASIFPKPSPSASRTISHTQRLATTDKLSSDRRRILVVLDLNGCILSRIGREERKLARQQSKFALPPSLGSISQKSVHRRPHAIPFVEQILGFPELDVAVWTSAKQVNAIKLVDLCLGSDTLVSRLKFVWHHGHCSQIPKHKFNKSEHAKLNPWDMLKDLSAVYKSMPDYSPESTIIVDDSPVKSILNPDNALLIPTWDLVHPDSNPALDTVLLDLACYLRLLVRSGCSDVRTWMAAHPFSVPRTTNKPGASHDLRRIVNQAPDFSCPLPSQHGRATNYH